MVGSQGRHVDGAADTAVGGGSQVHQRMCDDVTDGTPRGGGGGTAAAAVVTWTLRCDARSLGRTPAELLSASVLTSALLDGRQWGATTQPGCTH